MTREQINALYDAFEKKDMSRTEFHKAYARLMDPATMQEDFARIRHQRTTKGQIDKVLGDGKRIK